MSNDSEIIPANANLVGTKVIQLQLKGFCKEIVTQFGIIKVPE